MAGRQMAKSVSRWCLFKLEEGVEWRPTRVSSWSCSLSYFHKLSGQGCISSNVLKFADDTKVYRVIDNQLDGHITE